MPYFIFKGLNVIGVKVEVHGASLNNLCHCSTYAFKYDIRRNLYLPVNNMPGRIHCNFHHLRFKLGQQALGTFIYLFKQLLHSLGYRLVLFASYFFSVFLALIKTQ